MSIDRCFCTIGVELIFDKVWLSFCEYQKVMTPKYFAPDRIEFSHLLFLPTRIAQRYNKKSIFFINREKDDSHISKLGRDSRQNKSNYLSRGSYFSIKLQCLFLNILWIDLRLVYTCRLHQLPYLETEPR